MSGFKGVGAFGSGALLVDARPIGHPTARQRGIGRYVTGLLRGLAEIGAPVIALYDDDDEAQFLSDEIAGLAIERWSRSVVRDHATNGTWFVATQLMLHPIPLDPIPRVVTDARIPVAAVMYDVIPYRFPERYHVEADARNQSVLRASLGRTTDALLAISQFACETAAAELAYPIDRIGVIGAGVEPQFRPLGSVPRDRPPRLLPGKVGKYVVAVTGGDERKNTEGLIDAWGRVDPAIRCDHHLVVACAHSAADLRKWQARAVAAGVADDIVFTGALDDDEMVAVHQWAALSVMPSFEEGFGLPVLEAAASGIPAICSDLTSLPEVLDEPAACFDPGDPDAIARAIERALVDEAHRSLLLRAGTRAAQKWTWANVARDTVVALSSLGRRWPQTSRAPRRVVALAGPFGGSASGIGRYDESVLDAMLRQTTATDRESVRALVDGSASTEPAIGPTDRSVPGERLPVRAIGRFFKPWDFDHIVAALGSSPHHVATAALASSTPCHVWLHETSLVGMHVGLAHSSGSEDWALDYVRSVIESTEKPELASKIGDEDLLDAERLHQLGVTMLAPNLAAARSVIVSSDQAAATVRRMSPTGPPLLVVPLAYPPVSPERGLSNGREIVAAGWLADNKEPMLALRLLERVRDIHDVTLAFVGPALDSTAEQVREAANELGLTDRVTITGRLDDDTYHRRIGEARVGLQLRTGDRGEMSAAVMDLMAAGVPTVTTLRTAGSSSPGLRVVGHEIDELLVAIHPLLTDGAEWLRASHDARARAAAWTFDDVARELLAWLDDVDDLERSTIRRVGPFPTD